MTEIVREFAGNPLAGRSIFERDPDALLVPLMRVSPDDEPRVVRIVRFRGFSEGGFYQMLKRAAAGYNPEEMAGVIRQQAEEVGATRYGFIGRKEAEKIIEGGDDIGALGRLISQQKNWQGVKLVDVSFPNR